MRKGQFLSMDLFLATIVFVGILVSFLSVWQFAQTKSADKDLKSDIALQTHAALNVLLQTSGQPASWEELSSINQSAVQSIGLVNEPFSLSGAKLSRLSALNSTNYETYKVFLGLQGYEFELQVYPYNKAANQFSSTANFHIGKSQNTNISLQAAQERVVEQDGLWKKVVLEVWKP